MEDAILAMIGSMLGLLALWLGGYRLKKGLLWLFIIFSVFILGAYVGANLIT